MCTQGQGWRAVASTWLLAGPARMFLRCAAPIPLLQHSPARPSPLLPAHVPTSHSPPFLLTPYPPPPLPFKRSPNCASSPARSPVCSWPACARCASWRHAAPAWRSSTSRPSARGWPPPTPSGAAAALGAACFASLAAAACLGGARSLPWKGDAVPVAPGGPARAAGGSAVPPGRANHAMPPNTCLSPSPKTHTPTPHHPSICSRIVLASQAVQRLEWSAFPALAHVQLQVRGGTPPPCGIFIAASS
jgi:hypothetical protein